ncbi:hypothetical protein CEB3_c05290 [Peptococcaceae bacterium CEB3]|nr:hypothetical protein CEB3_c05290 [Peptococcaceae bacterium CEB3]
MYCITREDMKFGQYFVPARTKAKVISKPMYHDVGLPGLQLYIAIKLFDIHPNPKAGAGVPLSEVEINNELEGVRMNGSNSKMEGIVVYTHGNQVYMDGGDEFYASATLSKLMVQRIFGEDIPKFVDKAQYTHDCYTLESVIGHLENEFSDWVKGNCDFKILTEEDIENGEGMDGSEPGDSVLSELGLKQFYEKQLEFQKKLEVTGFTYEFKGGLIWE